MNNSLEDQKEIAYSSIFIITVLNLCLCVLMFTEVVPLYYGMSVCVVGMLSVAFVSWKMLVLEEKGQE